MYSCLDIQLLEHKHRHDMADKSDNKKFTVSTNNGSSRLKNKNCLTDTYLPIT